MERSDKPSEEEHTAESFLPEEFGEYRRYSGDKLLPGHSCDNKQTFTNHILRDNSGNFALSDFLYSKTLCLWIILILTTIYGIYFRPLIPCPAIPSRAEEVYINWKTDKGSSTACRHGEDGRTRIQQPHAQQGGGRATEKNVARHVRWAHHQPAIDLRETAFANRTPVHATHFLCDSGFRIGRSRHENGYNIGTPAAKPLNATSSPYGRGITATHGIPCRYATR